MKKRELGYKKIIYLVLIFSLLFSFFSIRQGDYRCESAIAERCVANVVSNTADKPEEIKVSSRLWELLFGKGEKKSGKERSQ